MKATQFASLIAIIACTHAYAQEEINMNVGATGSISEMAEDSLLDDLVDVHDGNRERELRSRSLQAPTMKSSKAPTLKSSKAPTLKSASSKAPTLKSSKAPTLKSSRRDLLNFSD